jgi:hypothetical protein
MNLGNPQSFNRYSYVENQPTNFVDPSGLLIAIPRCSLGCVLREGSDGYYWDCVETCTWTFINIGGTSTSITPQQPIDVGGGFEPTVGGSGGPDAPAAPPQENKDYKSYDECVKAEKRKCYWKGRNNFDQNVWWDVVGLGGGTAGFMNTIYQIVTKGGSLWALRIALGPIGIGGGMALGLDKAAQRGKAIEDECNAEVPDKCKQYKRS